MTDPGFQKVLLDRPLHEIAVDRGLGDFLVVFDGFVVIVF